MTETPSLTVVPPPLDPELDAIMRADSPDLFQEQASTERRWKPLTGTALLEAADLPAPEASVLRDSEGRGLLYREQVNLLSGEAGTGKTWLALEAARQEAITGGSVLWIDLENSARTFAHRLKNLGLPRASFDRIEYLDPEGTFDLDSFEDYLERQWSLVVIDSMTAALGLFTNDGDSNSGDSIQRLYTKRLRPLTKTGAAVLLIDHKAKAATKTQSRHPIGSERKLSALQGAAYTVEALQVPAPGAFGQLLLTLDKDNSGGVRERLAADRERRSLTQEAAFIEVDSLGVSAGNSAPTVIRVQPPRPLTERRTERLEDAAMVLADYLASNPAGVLSGRAAILETLRSQGLSIKVADLVPLLESGAERSLWSFERVGSRQVLTLRSGNRSGTGREQVTASTSTAEHR